MVCSYQDDEIHSFLDIVMETNSLKRIDGKTITNIKIFEMLAEKVNGMKVEVSET